MKEAREYDCVILQRKLLDPSDMRVLRANAKRIFYDLDDAVMLHQKPLEVGDLRETMQYAAIAAD